MPPGIDQRTSEFIREHRVAHLATSGADQKPVVVPICFVFDGEHIYTPLDEKPKSVEPGALKRVRNIHERSQVTLVIDDYSEDWSKLAYVLITGSARIISPTEESSDHSRATELLREKYPQYRSMKIHQRPMIKIKPTKFKCWSAQSRKKE
jgi:PPOX class probable F420-dependent enzyme